MEVRLELPSFNPAQSSEWDDDFYLCISSSDALSKNCGDQTILECQALRAKGRITHLGLSAHACHGGTWGDRIFSTSAALSSSVSQLQLNYRYNASTHAGQWNAVDLKNDTVISSHQLPPSFVSTELANASAAHLHVYRKPIGINIVSLMLKYLGETNDTGTAYLDLHGKKGSASPKEQINQKLRRLRTLIADDPSRDWTIQKAANYVSLSESRFYYLYKQYFGLTFMSDVIRSRINRSCSLLITTQKTVREIARSVGYTNDALFYRQFKEQMGITPREYQELYQGTLG